MSTELQATSRESLENLLTEAIAQVRSGEQPAEMLANVIMVTIQTEIARSTEGIFRSLVRAMKVST